jgi:RNA polymerase sigma factor (sigma-70 family)
MKSDADLLREYAETKSESAFTELVGRHVDVVYSAALRQVGGDAHLAKDAAQSVFNDLARKAPALLDRTMLAGWLYKSSHFAAAKIARSERRRKKFEHEASLMDEPTPVNDEPDWDHLSGLLDSAMLELNEVDREAVLLRFFTGRSFADVGDALRMSEDTARKRVARALDKLHRLLGKRGVSVTAGGLGLALAQHAAVGAPIGLAGTLATAAASGVVTASVGTSATVGILTLMSTFKIAALVAAGVALTLGSVFYYAERAKPQLQSAETARENAPADRRNTLQEPVDTRTVTSQVAAPPGMNGERVERYRRLVRQLREAGFDENEVRLFVRASLDQDLAKKKSLLMAALPFWRETLTPEMVEAMRGLQRENRKLLGMFLGGTAELESQDSPLLKRQYGDLSLARAAKVEEIKNDYADMRNAVRQKADLSTADRNKQQVLLREQEDADLAKILNPEELEAFQMRNSATAAELSRYVAAIDLTDSQFTDLFRLHQAFNQKARGLTPPQLVLAQSDLYEAAKKILPPSQYYNYLASADGVFGSIKTVTDTSAIDPSVALEAAKIIRKINAGDISAAAAASQVIEILGPAAAKAYQETPMGKWLGRYAK